jgi:transcriptional regulator with XRE-family HTH domain
MSALSDLRIGIKNAFSNSRANVRRVYGATVVEHGLRRAKYLDTSFPKYYRRHSLAPALLFRHICRGHSVEMGHPMKRLNVTGAFFARKRHELGWTQDFTAARLQVNGADISRQMLANIECGRTQVTDIHLMAFQKVFQIAIVRLFPLNVQALDEQLLAREKEIPQKIKRGRR